MNVQEALDDFGSRVIALKGADIVVNTREIELSGAQTALGNANAVQHDTKVAAKVSFDAVLAEVAKLGLDDVVATPVRPIDAYDIVKHLEDMVDEVEVEVIV